MDGTICYEVEQVFQPGLVCGFRTATSDSKNDFLKKPTQSSQTASAFLSQHAGPKARRGAPHPQNAAWEHRFTQHVLDAHSSLRSTAGAQLSATNIPPMEAKCGCLVRCPPSPSFFPVVELVHQWKRHIFYWVGPRMGGRHKAHGSFQGQLFLIFRVSRQVGA